jgi:hypothetical protein
VPRTSFAEGQVAFFNSVRTSFTKVTVRFHQFNVRLSREQL